MGYFRYLTDCTRPYLAFIVGKLGAGNTTPTARHWKIIKAAIRYVQATKNYSPIYKRQYGAQFNEVEFYSYADFAWDGVDRKYATGMLITYNTHKGYYENMKIKVLWLYRHQKLKTSPWNDSYKRKNWKID